MKFPRSVDAARAIGMDKKSLAEALLAEVPPRRGRPPAGRASIEDQLRSVSAEILAETGETYDWSTLQDYRNVAAWVAGNEGVNTPISWSESSWTAHLEAYKAGMPHAEFAQGKRTKRNVRVVNGGATGDVPAATRAINENPAEAEKLVEGLTDKAMDAVAEAALNREIERATGSRPGPRRTPGDPEPRWSKLSRRIALDVIEVKGEINRLQNAGQQQQADLAVTRIREVLATAVAEFEDIPDSLEGLTP